MHGGDRAYLRKAKINRYNGYMNPLLILGVASSAVQLAQEVGKNVSGLKNLLTNVTSKPESSPFAQQLKSQSHQLDLVAYVDQYHLNDLGGLKEHTDYLVGEFKQNSKVSDWLQTAQEPIFMEKLADGHTALVDSHHQRLYVAADAQPTLDMIFNLQSIEQQVVKKNSSSIQAAALDAIALAPSKMILNV